MNNLPSEFECLNTINNNMQSCKWAEFNDELG